MSDVCPFCGSERQEDKFVCGTLIPFHNRVHPPRGSICLWKEIVKQSAEIAKLRAVAEEAVHYINNKRLTDLYNEEAAQRLALKLLDAGFDLDKTTKSFIWLTPPEVADDETPQTA